MPAAPPQCEFLTRHRQTNVITLLSVYVQETFYYYFHLTASFQDKLVSQYQKYITILKHEMMGWQWHQPDHMQIICSLLQKDNHNSTSSLNFYELDALPAAQPTVSNH